LQGAPGEWHKAVFFEGFWFWPEDWGKREEALLGRARERMVVEVGETPSGNQYAVEGHSNARRAAPTARSLPTFRAVGMKTRVVVKRVPAREPP
jgi:hypothetical protein